jgi:holo-[acyl-carrier protein] synthase
MDRDGVVAEAIVVVEIAEAAVPGERATPGPFTDGELAYARSKSDPERRLAARLAAKRAARQLLGPDMREDEVEVVRDRGCPPTLRFSPAAQARLRALGASRALVSLTHGREHAAALVLLVS